ncbi:hypothetical protein F1649_06780 [Arcticibacter tournemirensis]|uniref:Restriction endonuclease type II-like domain-containing protein n=1 Tax=Arcticibacter tournemirensis TaxID=699437 RepID=A0A5M9HAS1_9SPHI|nr:hypothetical protein [Arcticibacter tournemirensis]KAA8484046.1 hypothetical protein F1649_06780 [Arcticibacter tournemirensis]
MLRHARTFGKIYYGDILDGDTYGAARSARDRDRLRMQVLEAIGWKMWQVWSTDWFRNPERELRRLAEAKEGARAQAATDDIIEEELQKEMAALIREEVQEVEVLLPVYEFAELPGEIASMELE